jgi:hypothetical protein
MNNIPEIRDIQYPDGVSVFPLAYGWWVIIIGVILLFFAIIFINNIIKKSRKHYALKKIDVLNTSNVVESAIEMSNILRRICLLKYKEASTLFGDDWIKFLVQKSTTSIDEEVKNLLLYAPFINKNTTKFSEKDAQKLKLFCKNWIGANL